MYHDLMLQQRSYKTVTMPLNTYCALHKCQTLMKVGTPAKKYDGATFTHLVCPGTPLRAYAPHKHPNTGLRLG